jgi:hypothetical protein
MQALASLIPPKLDRVHRPCLLYTSLLPVLLHSMAPSESPTGEPHTSTDIPRPAQAGSFIACIE